MRIAQVIGTYEYGGIGTIITNIANGLKKEGHEVEIVCVRKRLDPKNIKVVSFESKLKPSILWGTIKMINYLKKFDVIHVHGSLPIIYALFKRKGQKVVYTHHGWHIGVKETEFKTKVGSALFLKLYQLLAPKIDVFIGISKWAQKEIKLFFNRESFLLRNPVDGDRFKPRKNVNKFRIGNPTILSIGKNWPHKGHVSEILSLKEILKFYPEARLLIVGRGCESLLPLIKRLNLAKNVKVLEFVEDNELPLLYNSSDVFLTASHWELFGLPILEAIFSGVPVVGRGVFAIRELIEESKAGKIFIRDEEIPRVLIKVLSRKDKYVKNALKFRKIYINENNWETYIRNCIKIYSNVKK
jgi:glycosyltransferase involved in cell wall biosynthesis